jgi:Tfp pilus assembly protein PilF
MSANEVLPANARGATSLSQLLWFFGTAVVLLGPLVALIYHRTVAPEPSPREREIPATVVVKGSPHTQEIASAVQESQRLLDLGQAEASLVPIGRVLAMDPKNAVAYNNLCVAFGLLKKRGPAVAACNRALEFEPANERTRNNLRWVSSLPERANP